VKTIEAIVSLAWEWALRLASISEMLAGIPNSNDDFSLD
jgi:hypothetical protein